MLYKPPKYVVVIDNIPSKYWDILFCSSYGYAKCAKRLEFEKLEVINDHVEILVTRIPRTWLRWLRMLFPYADLAVYREHNRYAAFMLF